MIHATRSTGRKKAGLGLSAAIALMACALVAALSAAPGTVAPAYAAGYQAGDIATASTYGLTRGTTFKVGGNTYKITDYEPYDDDMGEVMLVKYGSTKTTVSVNTVKYKGETFEVDTIGKNAFNNSRGHKVVSVTLGRCVDSVRAQAFYGCKKLKKLNMAKTDLIDIERGPHGFYIDDIEIGSNAFKKAGVAKVKVNCGSNNASYKSQYKKALMKRGMRSDVVVVR